MEMNSFLDPIIGCVIKHGGKRAIVFSSFNPDICTMWGWKELKKSLNFDAQADTQTKPLSSTSAHPGTKLKVPRLPWSKVPDAFGTSSSVNSSRTWSLRQGGLFGEMAGLLGVSAMAEALTRDPTQMQLVKERGQVILFPFFLSLFSRWSSVGLTKTTPRRRFSPWRTLVWTGWSTTGWTRTGLTLLSLQREGTNPTSSSSYKSFVDIEPVLNIRLADTTSDSDSSEESEGSAESASSDQPQMPQGVWRPKLKGQRQRSSLSFSGPLTWAKIEETLTHSTIKLISAFVFVWI